MTQKEFMNRVANGKIDFLQSFIDILNKKKISFCVIGGLAVNAYAEPLVSLDLDIVVVSQRLDELVSILREKFRLKRYPYSVNVYTKGSDFRIQIQIEDRYQPFIKRALKKNVLGYKIPVACIEDVFAGKTWAAMDRRRRRSKRDKDLLDIKRLIEVKPRLKSLLPPELKKQ